MCNVDGTRTVQYQSTTRETHPTRPGYDRITHNYDVAFDGNLLVWGHNAITSGATPPYNMQDTRYVFDESAQTVNLTATYTGQESYSVLAGAAGPLPDSDPADFRRNSNLQYQLNQINVNATGSVAVAGYYNDFDFTIRSVDPTNIVNNSTALTGGFNGRGDNGGFAFGTITGTATFVAGSNGFGVYTPNTNPGHEGTGWSSPYALQYNDIVATVTTTLDETGLVTPTVSVTDGIQMNGSRITGLGDGVAATDAVNKGQLDAEAAARTTADTALATSISDEAATRAAADTALATAINQEATTRATTDTVLADAITAETTARTTADTQLTTAVTTEATTRTAADTALNQRIDTETAARTALSNAVTAETNARIAEDTQMGTRISTLETRLDGYDAKIKGFDNKIDGATSVAIAMGGTTFLPDMKFNLSTNVGHYGGEQAGSVSFGALVTPNVAINGGIAKGFTKKGKTGARAGVTFGW